MEQVEMNNTYINMGVNNGSEEWKEKKRCGFWYCQSFSGVRQTS